MVSRLTIALSAAVLGTALCASPAWAQGRGGRGAAPPRGGQMELHFGPHQGRGGFGHGRGRGFSRGEYAPYPYYPYDYYPFGGYQEQPPAPAQPPVRVVVVRPAPAPAPPAPPPESLLLEDHHGKWVRVPTGSHVPTGPLATQPESSTSSGSRAGASRRAREAQPLVKVPRTILVFRDGRKEKITKYVIQGAFIYASVDYWSAGSWTRKIPISELNVPATLRINRERGLKFSLPSGPDEVMVGF